MTITNNDPRPVLRQELSRVFKNQRVIRAFEKIFDLIPPEFIDQQILIDTAIAAANFASAQSTEVAAALDRLTSAVERSALAPPMVPSVLDDILNPVPVIDSFLIGDGLIGLPPDSRPAIDQSIIPLWTGAHTFANGVAIQWKDLGGTVRTVLLQSNVAGADRLLINVNGTNSYLQFQRGGAVVLVIDVNTAAFSLPVKVPSYTVAALPVAATVGAGSIAFVTDATLTAITGLGLAPIGGGANKVLVYSDGAGWLII